MEQNIPMIGDWRWGTGGQHRRDLTRMGDTSAVFRNSGIGTELLMDNLDAPILLPTGHTADWREKRLPRRI